MKNKIMKKCKNKSYYKFKLVNKKWIKSRVSNFFFFLIMFVIWHKQILSEFDKEF